MCACVCVCARVCVVAVLLGRSQVEILLEQFGVDDEEQRSQQAATIGEFGWKKEGSRIDKGKAYNQASTATSQASVMYNPRAKQSCIIVLHQCDSVGNHGEAGKISHNNLAQALIQLGTEMSQR